MMATSKSIKPSPVTGWTSRKHCPQHILVLSAATVLLLLLSLLISSANAVPVEGECLPGSDLTELCQRCAKFTKAVNAFSLCCNAERELNATPPRKHRSVRSWCSKFLAFRAPYYNKDLNVRNGPSA